MLQKFSIALFLLTISTAAAQAENSFKLTKFDKELLKQTNEQRAAYNLPPLKMDRELMRSARRHCYWMADSGNFQHGNAPVAENIAWNQQDVSEAISAWMNSPGHRANMLSSGYNTIGVSCYQATDGSFYWCQQFSNKVPNQPEIRTQ